MLRGRGDGANLYGFVCSRGPGKHRLKAEKMFFWVYRRSEGEEEMVYVTVDETREIRKKKEIEEVEAREREREFRKSSGRSSL